MRHPSLRAATAALLLAVAPAALADAPRAAGCTTDGMNWTNDPVFRASLHPSERDQEMRAIPCEVELTRDIVLDGLTLRLTLGRLFHDRVGGPLRNLKLVDVADVGPTGPRSIARLFLGADPIDGEIRFAPQARTIDGAIVVRLSPRHRWMYRLEEGRLSAFLAFGWRDALDEAFPDGARSGENLGVDLERMEGRIAIRSIAKDPGQAPGSAYGEDRVMTARLAFHGDRLVAESTTIAPRRAGEEPFLDRIREMDETIRQGLTGLPDGVEPCSLGAWSVDADPRGLNVRAQPSAGALSGGGATPRTLAPSAREAFGPEPVRAEFRVIGHKDGWFLIENIQAPGAPYGIAYPRNLPQPFKGRGWVGGRLIGGALANGGLPSGRLYVSPHADAAFLTAGDGAGDPIRRIHACSGWWALVETNEGRRGWWRALCSNQATTCS
jgi:hypothetical protein